jgi:DNA-binding protein HU-beta
MTKDDLVKKISRQTGIERSVVSNTVEALMETIKGTMAGNKNVYLRGFGSFLVKKRAQKTARNITKNTVVIVPEHFTPAFKPSKEWLNKLKSKKA